MSADDTWYEEDAGRLVRPYTITGGRTSADSAPLDVATMVSALRSESDVELEGLGPEHVEVMRLCRSMPMSVAEIAAYMHVPLGVVRVLCGDLIKRGDLIARSSAYGSARGPDLDTLQEVLDGLHKL